MKHTNKALLVGVFAWGILSCPNLSQAMSKDTLNYGCGGVLTSANPQEMNSVSDYILAENVFESLLVFNNKGELIPGLATSWESKDNATKFIFHLRKNVKWSDGTALTADDVVFSFQHLLDPKTAAQYASLMYAIKNAKEVVNGKKPMSSLGVRKIDNYTVEFTTTDPTPFFPSLITESVGDIIPKATVLKYGKEWTKPENIVSQGAYKITKWVPGTSVTLEANPYYYDAKNVHIKHVNIITSSALEPLINLFVTKKLDVVNGSLGEKMDLIESKRPHTVHIYKYPGVYYLAVNVKDPLIGGSKNTDIRHALAMSVNRVKVLKAIKSHAPYSHTFVPEGISGISHPVFPYWHSWSFAKRVREAKKIMAKHGYNKKHPLVIRIDASNVPTSKRLLIATLSYWKKIGVNAKMDVYEAKTHSANMRKRNFQIGLTAWILDYDDAYDFLSLVSLKIGGVNNVSGYDNPTFNKYFNQANKEGDLKKRGDLFVKAETQLMKDLPVIPFYYSISSNLVSGNISGYYDNISGRHPLKYYQFKH